MDSTMYVYHTMFYVGCVHSLICLHLYYIVEDLAGLPLGYVQFSHLRQRCYSDPLHAA